MLEQCQTDKVIQLYQFQMSEQTMQHSSTCQEFPIQVYCDFLGGKEDHAFIPFSPDLALVRPTLGTMGAGVVPLTSSHSTSSAIGEALSCSPVSLAGIKPFLVMPVL